MMVRTQISLDDADLQLAKRRAGELGISLAELIRRALRKELGTAEKPNGISAIFGMITGPVANTGTSIDEDVADHLDEEHEHELRERHLLPE